MQFYSVLEQWLLYKNIDKEKWKGKPAQVSEVFITIWEKPKSSVVT